MTFLISILLNFNLSADPRPDEGMWLPMLINQNFEGMKKLGFELSPEQIYSINNSSIKDAIVSFGGYCTGEIISSEGLILTNHHCGYDEIQALSSEEKNYLENGFWAKDRASELSSEGLHVSFLLAIEDVTEEVLKSVNDEMSYNKRKEAIDSVINILKENAFDSLKLKDSEKEFYRIEIKPFLHGNKYYQFSYQSYHDIRLVGTPPDAIGKFGGDTDNWMWPRHTADFSLFRIYADKDGKPSHYNKENVPLKVKSHLPISLNGVEKNDFAMVVGFPGRTERYKTSFGIASDMTIANPARIKLRKERLAIMKEDMNSEVAIDIKYASKYAQISNYYKYFIGQNKGLKRLNTLGKKRSEEASFNEWASGEESQKYISKKVLDKIKDSYIEINKYRKAQTYMLEGAFAPEIIEFAYKFMRLYSVLSKGDVSQGVLEPIKVDLIDAAKAFYKDYNLPTDKKVFSSLMKITYDDIDQLYYPSFFLKVEKKYKGSFDKYADHLYSKSILRSEQSVKDFLKAPSAKALDKDLGFITMQSVLSKYRELYMRTSKAKNNIKDQMRLYTEGLTKMFPEKKFYSDANSTMRISYGKVIDYNPRDAVHFEYFTNIEGVIEKMDNTDDEFKVPAKLFELYNAKDYGKYGDGSNLRVCFITDNDITGGNSGSPVINGKGELIGCAFDGNWEAMTGDLVYDAELKRCINVDVRYILFIIDKYANAGHLIDEMTIRQNSN